MTVGPGVTPFEIAYVAVCAVVVLVFAYKMIRSGRDRGPEGGERP